VPTWTPDTTVFGARLSFSVAFYPGWNRTSADLAVGALSVNATDDVTGFGDLYPTAQLFWNTDVHNWMTYVTGDIPVGSYDPNRLPILGSAMRRSTLAARIPTSTPRPAWSSRRLRG
jgi:hypothetical protein